MMDDALVHPAAHLRGRPATSGTAREAAADRAAPALMLSGVTKRWGERTILDRIDLVAERGTTTWVHGANGAGKTTLLRIAAGLIMADEGTIAIRGYTFEHQRREYQRRVGFLPAGNSGLYARLSVRRNLEFWTSLALVPRRRRAGLVEQAIVRFGLEHLADRRTDRLSLGERQRARLALTFLHDPEVVLLDEPASSLDDTGVALLVSAVRSFVEAGGATVWCSPNRMEDVAFDRSYVLHQGRLEPR